MLSDRTLTRSALAAVVFAVSASTLAAAQQRAPVDLYAKQQRPVERTESAPPPPQVFVDRARTPARRGKSSRSSSSGFPPRRPRAAAPTHRSSQMTAISRRIRHLRRS